jgi:hypothetical protein
MDRKAGRQGSTAGPAGEGVGVYRRAGENEVRRRIANRERVYYLVRPAYRSLLRPIGLDVYIASSRSPVITDWVPNAPPDAQPTLFNDSGY